MKLALHRSVSFWSGLLVITFIVWAWQDSVRNFCYLRYGRWNLLHTDCGLVMMSWSTRHLTLEAGRDYQRSTFVGPKIAARAACLRRGAGESEWECRARFEADYPALNASSPGFFFVLTTGMNPGDWVCYIPDSWLLAGFLPIWLGILVWRAKRKRRKGGLLVNIHGSIH